MDSKEEANKYGPSPKYVQYEASYIEPNQGNMHQQTHQPITSNEEGLPQKDNYNTDHKICNYKRCRTTITMMAVLLFLYFLKLKVSLCKLYKSFLTNIFVKSKRVIVYLHYQIEKGRYAMSLKVAHVSKKFKDITAVDDISFELETGKMLGFWDEMVQVKRRHFV